MTDTCVVDLTQQAQKHFADEHGKSDVVAAFGTGRMALVLHHLATPVRPLHGRLCHYQLTDLYLSSPVSDSPNPFPSIEADDWIYLTRREMPKARIRAYQSGSATLYDHFEQL